MDKNINRFIINPGLLIFGMASVFSGIFIQVNYHMGQHGDRTLNETGITYSDWSAFHKISIVAFSAFILVHIYRHWKWYKGVITKKLISKNQQVLVLSLLFILVALTGLIPWFIDLLNGDQIVRESFIEIHDKLALILSVYLILHIVKRLRWLFK
ncbi:MAG TPA: DUF4405 domain-containing protein [Bacteroidales bacterium]|nr:DUF4405 domain-containing protein [Bacteroidales bacterium]